MISVSNLKKEFGGAILFENVSFNINPKDRIGLAGVNGAGKSTLLKIMAGELHPESGKIIFPPDITVGYLPQEKQISSVLPIFEETMLVFKFLDLYKAEIEVIHSKLENVVNYDDSAYSKLIHRLGILNDTINLYSPSRLIGDAEKYLMGLGFKRSDLERPMIEFSQGWQMRVEIAKLLLLKPDLLLLDEPTNHLDIESIQWVEDFLAIYSGSVVVVSHDRKLLDSITNRTIEISNGKMYDYKASYSDYIIQREEREVHLNAVYNNQQKEIDEVEKFIEKFRYKASKAKQVQSRVKQLARMDVQELDNIDKSSVHFLFPPAPHSGKVTISGKGICKSYGNNTVLNNIDIEVVRGEKIALLGKNGEGKSTLAKIIAGNLDFEGELKLGHQVSIGYFAQDQGNMLDPELTVFETIDNSAVGEIRKRINSILGAFLFQGDDINKKVKVLSGGEKSRLSLALLLLTPSNLLLLDEPTNHLDLRTKDILKNALLHYDGTVVIVSHDRDFLQGLTDRLYEFNNKVIKEFRGDVNMFLEKRKIDNLQELEKQKRNSTSQTEKQSVNKLQWENKKELDKKIRKLKNIILKVESEIEDNEAQLEIVNNKLSNPIEYAEEIKSGELYRLHDKITQKIDDAMEEWDSKSNELENLKSEN